MEKINRTLVTTQVTDYLRECIVSGKWKLNEKIPSENVLSKELGVSRATLRMAISRFVTLKILKPEQGRGCYLISDAVERLGSGIAPETSYHDIKAVLEFRLLVEPQGLNWALQQDSKAINLLTTQLEQTLARMKISIGDPELFIHADMDFHKAIAAASGNEVLNDSLCRVFENTGVSHKRMNGLFGFENGLKYHERILNAIKDHDDRRAVRQLERHISVAIDELKKKDELEKNTF